MDGRRSMVHGPQMLQKTNQPINRLTDQPRPKAWQAQSTAIDNDGYGAVVYQCHFHIGTKLTGTHGLTQGAF